MTTTWNTQQPSAMPSHRYQPIWERVPVPEIDRTWPTRRITTAPLWVPVDLRDGNQALAEPMDRERKRTFFDLLVRMGYKEIEVGYPAASEADFEFVRDLARLDLVPDDVSIVVFTAAREDLIARTFQSIEGLANVVVHMYTATAPTWRSTVLGLERNDLRQLIVDAAEVVARESGDSPGRRFEFSPEVFNLTEPDFVLEVCNGLTQLWDASIDRPVIHNLPATVEVATPNVYADQIEYMHRNLSRRDAVILSVHPHNDRGTGIACAELAVLAGAQRVEGCLFGNGERTGNVDLATLALNLHSQGVDPMIDFGDIEEIRRTVEYCNSIPVHDRHPYAGDLVFTAFSGTHQDAIKKGFAEHRRSAAEHGIAAESTPWAVPYLPIDPTDLGRDYEAVIRINSQSGKGGIAHILLNAFGIDLPRELQIEFAQRVQHTADASGLEITADELWKLFCSTYGYDGGIFRWSLEHVEGGDRLAVVFDMDGREVRGDAVAAGPVDAFVAILASHGIELEVQSFTQHSREEHGGKKAITLLKCRSRGITVWTMAKHQSVTASAIHAVYAAAMSARSRQRTP